MGTSERVDEAVEGLIEVGGPGVAIGVLRDGQFIHRKAYGLADLEWGTPLRPDCSFRICSLSKQFTATAIMHLAEQGALSIEDRLEVYLPAFDPRGRTVTLRHLLNHTSGIRNHDEGQGPRTDRVNIPHERVLAEILAAPFDFEPGDQYRYCNSGYILLGAVIEAVSGQDFETFLKRAFFEPLGMAQTSMSTPDRVIPLRARGYVRGRSSFHNARPDPMNWSYSAGGLCSTLDDLLIWDAALRGGSAIDGNSFEQMITPTLLADGTLYPYGLGWGTATYEGRRLHHHTGGVSGFACQMARLTDEALTTIVLSNVYMFPFDRLTRSLLRIALDLPPIKIQGRPATADDFSACGGRFSDEYGAEFRLGSAQNDTARYNLVGEGRFLEVNDPEIELRFCDLQGGEYQTLDYHSPLWPAQRFVRSAPSET
jgi:CubicO group peptidase (beta-lactamase class C family)